MSILILLGMFAGVVACIWLFDRLVLLPRRRREAEAAPRITLQEVSEIWDEIEAATLPMARALVDEDQVPQADGSRIGGAALILGDNRDWPRSEADGAPMFLLCQINFAEVPQIEDFPERGVLQVFSSLYGKGGSDRDVERVVRWDPDPDGADLIAVPAEILEKSRRTRDFSETTRRQGLALRFARHEAPGNPYNHPFSDRSGVIYENRLPEDEAVKAKLEGWEDRSEAILDSYGTHWIGGHPHFVQEDVREDADLRHLDRVVFHLGADAHINLGDGGMANVMISRQALLDRDFGKVYLTWDCS